MLQLWDKTVLFLDIHSFRNSIQILIGKLTQYEGLNMYKLSLQQKKQCSYESYISKIKCNDYVENQEKENLFIALSAMLVSLNNGQQQQIKAKTV